MKIALFGGTFDPPHNGHQLVADTLIAEKLVDEVWFVPVFEHPWADRYGKQLSDYNQRVEMIEHMTADSSQQKVAHYEGVSYTLDTLNFFAGKFPEHHFFWVMGSEYLSKFEDFLVDHPELMEQPFLIYPRAGFELEPVYGNMLVLSEVPVVEVSSTEVRSAIQEGRTLEKLVPATVRKYIKRAVLYLK